MWVLRARILLENKKAKAVLYQGRDSSPGEAASDELPLPWQETVKSLLLILEAWVAEPKTKDP